MPISAEAATSYIERNAPGTMSGWTWQKSWLGMYCFVIEGQIVNDNWSDRPREPVDDRAG